MTEGQSVYKVQSNQPHLMKDGAWLSRSAKFCTISSIGNTFLFHSKSWIPAIFILLVIYMKWILLWKITCTLSSHCVPHHFGKYLQLAMPTCCSGDRWSGCMLALLLLWPLTQSRYFARYLEFLKPAVNSLVVMVTGFAPSSFSLAKSIFCWGYQVCDSKTII